MELYQIYNPITATPFICNERYMEFEPCAPLKPYVKCFWGTKKPLKQLKTDIPTYEMVIPDTCMDIIFEADFTENRVNSCFCGLDERTFSTYNSNNAEKTRFSFAIRFYAWSGILFSEESMRDTCNAFFDAGIFFSKIKAEIEPLLFEIANMKELINRVEKILLKNICEKHKNLSVLEAVGKILLNKGNLQVGQLSKDLHISSRQLERLFRDYVGVSPKSLLSMVRYQYLWNDILYAPDFNILDAVYQYGYTDQAHLLRDFRKFHSMNISEARKYAMKDVAFIQE